MERSSYVSCIKINGVPILPPMMTKDIKEEMTYYKQLALTVEKKLAALRLAKKPDGNGGVETSRKLSENSDLEEAACNLAKLVGKDDVTIETLDGSPVRDASPQNSLEESSKLEDGKPLARSTDSNSASVVTTVDLHNWSNRSTPLDSTEITPETSKPQVPKTLDIVPLTLVSPDDEQSEERSRNSDDTPKLVRQGSYVLDTPSPMLLAHMQTELANSVSTPSTEYTPTPTANVSRRKEWNIAQAKTEWEHRSRNDSTPDSLGSLIKHETNCRSEPSQKLRKSVSLQAKSEFPLEIYPPTRSVDCIQAMLAKEYIGRSNVKGNRDQKCAGDCGNNKNQRAQKWKKSESCSILNLANKLGGSLGNLNSTGIPFSKSVGSEKNAVRNGLGVESSRKEKIQDSAYKLQSSVASNKLLTVYKEIQEMHKKQMVELVSRQQREQTLLQKEFEKQQLLLLTEIKKSFPEVSVSVLSENLPSATLSRSPGNENHSEAVPGDVFSDEKENINLQQETDKRCPTSDSATTTVCPLDYIYPENNYHDTCVQGLQSAELSNSETLEEVDDFLSTATENQESQNSDPNDCKLNDVGNRKSLGVSRQLFPLNSNTCHVPVLENAVYSAKHIRAANVINAYARGYLVRRMMQTERVIALKTTYKEALHFMLLLHVDAPLKKSEFNFLHRLQLQCDAASMNIVDLFTQSTSDRMQIIAQDREIKRSRMERPTSARSYSFATQRTLARKKLKEMGEYRLPMLRSYSSRSRCQTWTSDVKENLISPDSLHRTIKRSTSAGTMRKPWR